MSELTKELVEQLVENFGNHCFDCGEWREGDGVLYDAVFQPSVAARKALIAEIDSLRAQVAAAKEECRLAGEDNVALDDQLIALKATNARLSRELDEERAEYEQKRISFLKVRDDLRSKIAERDRELFQAQLREETMTEKLL